MFVDGLSDKRISVNVSTALLLEYEAVLKRPEMSKFVSPDEVDEFLDGLCSIATYHQIHFLWRTFVSDPNDAFLLELAIRSTADFLITFNTKDFPEASDFGVKLETPREFLRTLGKLP